MSDQQEKEQSHYQQLEQDRLESAAKMSQSRQHFARAARQEAQKYGDFTAKQRAAQVGKNLSATRKALAAARKKKREMSEEEDDGGRDEKKRYRHVVSDILDIYFRRYIYIDTDSRKPIFTNVFSRHLVYLCR